MPIRGKAFMAIWHDIRTEAEPEYNRWHTREHMPERLSVPGFLRGRRGVDWKRDRYRYLTIYEGRELSVFGSPDYLQRLNNPTPWSVRVQPAFYNFIRSACDLLLSEGQGVGGAMATIRLGFGEKGAGQLRSAGPELAAAIMALDGVSSVHIGEARPDVTGAKTKETELRGMNRDGVFDAVVLVDGIGRGEVEAALPQVLALLELAGLTPLPADVAVYDMAFALDSLLEPTGP